MKFSFSDPTLPKSGSAAILVQADRVLGPAAADIDQRTGGMIGRAMSASRFSGKAGETLSVLAPAGVELDRILLVGIGKPEQVTTSTLQDAGGTAYVNLARNGSEASVLVELPEACGVTPDAAAAHMAFGARLRSYRFDKYRTKDKKEDKPSLKKLAFLSSEATAARKAFAHLDEVAEGVFLTRDLVSEPANVLYPETMADRCRELAELGVEVDILDEKRMKKLGMGALLGVGLGSARPPRLVTMVWNGAPQAADRRPVAFIGKGVTFDTGGISIKPAGGMEDMKWDMAGAGAVIGLMRALAGRKAKVNVVGVVGLVENMPSANAQRPGDIVTSMSGQTIEVINTDAEGRLVLADAMCYAQRTYKPRAMVDLATLTGAIIVALGGEFAGLFSNDDELAGRLADSGAKTAEKVWRMPLAEAYDKAINTDAADMKNV
ncbi:MAG TPA: leucyl aminopeptidase, partial [Arenibaculum sp.]|nr:leucyl aminopeptidase [Arenibaculum sp.]